MLGSSYHWTLSLWTSNKQSRDQQPVGGIHFKEPCSGGPRNSVLSQDHLLKLLPLVEKCEYVFPFQFSKKEVTPLSKPLSPCLVSEGIRNLLSSLPKSEMQFHKTKKHWKIFREKNSDLICGQTDDSVSLPFEINLLVSEHCTILRGTSDGERGRQTKQNSKLCTG